MVWKALRHPNILQLIGIATTKTRFTRVSEWMNNTLPLIGIATTKNQFTTVSEWMNNGNVNEFTKVHPNANRVELVCFPFRAGLFSMLVLKQSL